MQVYDFFEWSAQKDPLELELSERSYVDIRVSCTHPVKVFGVSGPATTLLKVGQEFRFNGRVRGFDRLRIEGEKEFGIRYRVVELQDGEDISPEKPPVVSLPEPSNLVLKMRQLSRAHHKQNRMPVLEPEDGPSFGSYEHDDDEELLFEEELLAKRLEERKKAKEEAKAKARKEAEDEAALAKPPQKALEPPPASEKGEPPPQQDAAE